VEGKARVDMGLLENLALEDSKGTENFVEGMGKVEGMAKLPMLLVLADRAEDEY
jgi:hypothetical protein